jgi:hypothetical protein
MKSITTQLALNPRRSVETRVNIGLSRKTHNLSRKKFWNITSAKDGTKVCAPGFFTFLSFFRCLTEFLSKFDTKPLPVRVSRPSGEIALCECHLSGECCAPQFIGAHLWGDLHG